jgi:hypothetical protein
LYLESRNAVGPNRWELGSFTCPNFDLKNLKEGTSNVMNRSSGTGINVNPAVDARAVKRINKELERIQRFVVCVSGHVVLTDNKTFPQQDLPAPI